MNQKQFPATIDEAVGVVIATLSDDEKTKIAAMPKSDLIGLHFGLRTWIRNHLGLWSKNGLLLESAGTLNSDDAALVIIEALWRRLRQDVPKVH